MFTHIQVKFINSHEHIVMPRTVLPISVINILNHFFKMSSALLTPFSTRLIDSNCLIDSVSLVVYGLVVR